MRHCKGRNCLTKLRSKNYITGLCHKCGPCKHCGQLVPASARGKCKCRRRICSEEQCTEQAQRNRVCFKHGSNGKDQRAGGRGSRPAEPTLEQGQAPLCKYMEVLRNARILDLAALRQTPINQLVEAIDVDGNNVLHQAIAGLVEKKERGELFGASDKGILLFLGGVVDVTICNNVGQTPVDLEAAKHLPPVLGSMKDAVVHKKPNTVGGSSHQCTTIHVIHEAIRVLNTVRLCTNRHNYTHTHPPTPSLSQPPTNTPTSC